MYIKDEFRLKGAIFDVLNVKEEPKFCAMRGEGVKKVGGTERY